MVGRSWSYSSDVIGPRILEIWPVDCVKPRAIASFAQDCTKTGQIVSWEANQEELHLEQASAYHRSVYVSHSKDSTVPLMSASRPV